MPDGNGERSSRVQSHLSVAEPDVEQLWPRLLKPLWRVDGPLERFRRVCVAVSCDRSQVEGGLKRVEGGREKGKEIERGGE